MAKKNGKKILVIDDDQTNVKLIETRLTKEGFDVSVAVDGDIGLGRAKEVIPDLIVLDIEMPRMNGYTFIQKLRKIEALQWTPVIVLTAHDDMQSTFEKQGIHEYLVKPVDFDELQKKINTCLEIE